MIISTDSFFLEASKKLVSLNKEIDPAQFFEPRLGEFSDGFSESSQSLDRADNLCQKITGIVVRLGFVLKSDYLAKFPNLKFVATITTGLDHIDLNYCQQKNISVLSLKGETDFLSNIVATPEHTWGLLLSLIRQIPSANYSVQQGRWQRELFFGSELGGKQLGIIGFGRVGKMLAQYANAFRMQVVYSESKVFIDHNSKKTDFLNAVSVSLDELLETSDVICVCTSYDDSTRHLLKREQFINMKKKPYLINTSRGPVLREKDLLEALQNKWIRGAALDVLEFENDFVAQKVNSELITYHRHNTNLIITPHVAGSTLESMNKTALYIEDKIVKNFPQC